MPADPAHADPAPADPTQAALALAANGVIGPLYFDRQIVQAEDLTLDRASHARELARMRRLLHGWGVVAGLIPTIAGGNLLVSAGYGITRTGDEIFLPEALAIADIAARVWACCGPASPGCDVLEPDERRRISDDSEQTAVTSWLVARSTQRQGDLRPGIAEGCEHLANTLLPTRACDMVSIELRCSLPPDLVPSAAACAAFSQVFCGAQPALLPMPPLAAEAPDVLVLGRIIVTERGTVATFEPADRRTVVPVAMLQDWLQACLCRLLEASPDTDPPGPAPRSWRELLPDLEANGFAPTPQPRLPGPGDRPAPVQPGLPGLGDRPVPVLRAAVPKVLLEPETVRILVEIGITGPEAFLAADRESVAQSLGRPLAEVEAMAEELAAFRPFFTGPRL